MIWFSFVEINNSIKADEKVVMTYVSSYYHAFSTTQKVICMRLDLVSFRENDDRDKENRKIVF